MKIDVIRNRADYRAALKRLEGWARSGKSQYHAAIDALTVLIGAYEEKHYPSPEADPIDAIRFRLKQLQWSQNKLAAQLDMNSGRLSEVMNMRRSLTLPMIRQIVTVLGIPADILIQPYDQTAQRMGRRRAAASAQTRNNLASS